MASWVERLLRASPASASSEASSLSALQDDAFLGFVNHELRTPLSAILGYAEILQEDAIFLDQKDFLPDLQKIQRASEHMLALVDDVVDLSRMDAGRLALAVEEFQPGEIVSEVERDARFVLERSFCTLDTEIPEGLPLVRGDRGKVRRSVSNLVRHALGLAQKGTLRLSVAAEAQRVVYRVEHADLSGRAADLSSTVAATTRSSSGLPQFHGSGLGLVITERFVRLMGGEIALEPTEGGAALRMSVPLAPVAVVAKSAEAR